MIMDNLFPRSAFLVNSTYQRWLSVRLPVIGLKHILINVTLLTNDCCLQIGSVNEHFTRSLNNILPNALDFKLKNNIGNSYIWGPAESETLVFSYVRNKSLLLSM